MDRHEWKDTAPAYKNWTFSVVAVHEDGEVYPGLHISSGGVEFSRRDVEEAIRSGVFAREIFRLAERDKINEANLENALADRDAARGTAEAFQRDVEAAELGVRWIAEELGLLRDGRYTRTSNVTHSDLLEAVRALRTRCADAEYRADPDALALWGNDRESVGRVAERERCTQLFLAYAEGWHGWKLKDGAAESVRMMLKDLGSGAIVTKRSVFVESDPRNFGLPTIRDEHYDTLQDTKGPEGTPREAMAREDSEAKKDEPGSDSSESG